MRTTNNGISIIETETSPTVPEARVDQLTHAGLRSADFRDAQFENEFVSSKLQKVFRNIIQAMLDIVEMRDPYTAGHQERVSCLSSQIAKEMALSADQIEGIRLAGLIHDIGKLNIPAEILCKPGRLSDAEFDLIKLHPLVGHSILKHIEFPWPIAEIVSQHHERVDGSGYPAHLSHFDILLEARIISVADVVEAMSTSRPYRKALGIDLALEEITKNRSNLYDCNAVDACLTIIEGGFKFPENIRYAHS